MSLKYCRVLISGCMISLVAMCTAGCRKDQQKPSTQSATTKPSTQQASSGQSTGTGNTTIPIHFKVKFTETAHFDVTLEKFPRENSPHPRAMDVDGNGNMFVLDPGQGVVHEIHVDGTDTPLSATGWTATHQHKVAAVDEEGNTIVQQQGLMDGHRALWDIAYGADIAVDNSGNIYLADGTNGIKEIIAQGGYTVVTRLTSDQDRATNYTAAAVDSKGNVFMGNKDNQVQELTVADRYQTIRTLGKYPFGNGINGMALDKDGNIFFTIVNSHVVYEIMAENDYNSRYRLIGTAPACYGRTPCIADVQGVKVDNDGNALFIDGQITHTEVNVLLARQGYTTMYIVDGISVANPNGLAVDGSGNVYLIDYDNRRIVKGRISIDGVSQ